MNDGGLPGFDSAVVAVDGLVAADLGILEIYGLLLVDEKFDIVFETRTFASAETFLQSGQLTETSCLISDVQMPNISGVELQQRLADQGLCIPMIFITAYPDDAVRARVLSAGAVCYLQKPFDHQSLMQCIGDALQRRGGEIAPD